VEDPAYAADPEAYDCPTSRISQIFHDVFELKIVFRAEGRVSELKAVFPS
jgi:hypothetical protein